MTGIQMDVDGAFTIPTLAENIYMQIPDGMEQIYANVLKLNKNLYACSKLLTIDGYLLMDFLYSKVIILYQGS
jgi:hypothetical protein